MRETAGLGRQDEPAHAAPHVRDAPARGRLRPALACRRCSATPTSPRRSSTRTSPTEHIKDGLLQGAAPATQPSAEALTAWDCERRRIRPSKLCGMPELPEVETIRRQLAPRVAGRTIERAQVLDPLWCAPAAPARGRARAARPAHRGSAAARQVPDRRPRRRAAPGHAPAHDRQPAVGAPGEDREPRPHLRVRLTLDDGHRLLFVDQRRFGTGVVIEGPRRARRVPRPAGRPGAARPGVHARRARARRARPPRAGEGVPARPAPGGGRREHLRRRGAVSRAASIRCARRAGCAAPRSSACTPASWRRSSAGSTGRAPRSTTTATRTASAARCRTSS